jgi:hypothetical protein
MNYPIPNTEKVCPNACFAYIVLINGFEILQAFAKQ